jgi:SAM-dependent methyltransferase
LWLYLKDKTNFFKDNLKVLDIAPKRSIERQFLKLKNLTYISADIVPNRCLVRMDITNTGLIDNQFDVILCYHVLEHIPDDRKAMRELFRILKPGGWAILQSPIDMTLEKTLEGLPAFSPDEKTKVYGHPDHVRKYGMDYSKRLEEAGFKVSVDDYVKKLDKETVRKYCLKRYENIYLCRKEK